MRAKLLKNLKLDVANAGQHLILEGDECKGFIVIVSGEATITKYIEADNLEYLVD
jgi:CRP-like cAMP-binding protein